MSLGWNYSTVTQEIKNGIILLMSYPALTFPSRFFPLSFSLYISSLLLYINKETRKSDLLSNCWMIKIKKQNCRFWAGSKWKDTKSKATDFFFHIQNKNISKCYMEVFNNKSYTATPPKNNIWFMSHFITGWQYHKRRDFFFLWDWKSSPFLLYFLSCIKTIFN